MRRLVLFSIVIASQVATTQPLLAQGDRPASGPALAWFSAGLGGATTNEAGLGAVGGVDLLTHGHLISLRVSGVAVPFGDSFWDAGILYGRARRYSRGLLAASAGVSIVDGERCRGSLGSTCMQERARIGFPLAARAVWTPSSYFGLGIAAFGNVNGVQSFAGLVLIIQAGRVR